MFLDVKQIIDFDVMIQKENLDDQEKNIKINDLKLRGTACGGEISSRNFHDQIWIEKLLTILRRRDANKKCPWSHKNWKILDKNICWISESCKVVCLFGCGVSLSKGRTSQLRGTACGGERPARKCRDTTRIENFLQRRFVECLKILEWFVRPAIRWWASVK